MALRDVDTVLRWRSLRTEIMESHMARNGGRAQLPEHRQILLGT
jgi:hypothetical protein